MPTLMRDGQSIATGPVAGDSSAATIASAASRRAAGGSGTEVTVNVWTFGEQLRREEDLDPHPAVRAGHPPREVERRLRLGRLRVVAAERAVALPDPVQRRAAAGNRLVELDVHREQLGGAGVVPGSMSASTAARASSVAAVRTDPPNRRRVGAQELGEQVASQQNPPARSDGWSA